MKNTIQPMYITPSQVVKKKYGQTWISGDKNSNGLRLHEIARLLIPSLVESQKLQIMDHYWSSLSRSHCLTWNKTQHCSSHLVLDWIWLIYVQHTLKHGWMNREMIQYLKRRMK